MAMTRREKRAEAAKVSAAKVAAGDELTGGAAHVTGDGLILTPKGAARLDEECRQTVAALQVEQRLREWNWEQGFEMVASAQRRAVDSMRAEAERQVFASILGS